MNSLHNPKILIIGLGNIGMLYDLSFENQEKILTHCKAFYTNEKFDLVGGVDIQEANRNLFEKNYKCPAFNEIKHAMINICPDIVVISSNSNNHLKNILEVFKFGKPKIIICEKPLSLKFKEACKIVEICKKNSSKLFVNYFRRSQPGFLEIYSRLKIKKIKPPFQGVCIYSKGMFNTSSHFIDLFQFYFGKVKKVRIINTNQKKADPQPDFELKFDNGNIVFFSNRNNDVFLNNIDLIMSNGKLTFENGGAQILWRKLKNDERFIGYKVLDDYPKIYQNDFDRIQFHFVEQINQALNNETVTLCSGQEALLTQNVLNQIKSKL